MPKILYLAQSSLPGSDLNPHLSRAMPFSQRSQSFRASKNNNQVTLSGQINDNTRFDLLDGLISDGVELNCEGLAQCSWIGLNEFFQALHNAGFKQLKLSKVPEQVYDYIKLIPEFGKKFEVISVQMQTHKAGLTLVEFSAVLASGQKPQNYLRSDAKVIRFPAKWVLPPYFHQSFPPGEYSDNWTKNEAEEFAFWQSYGFFVESTTGLANLLFTTLDTGLAEVIESIQTRVKSAQAGFSLILGERIENVSDHFLNQTQEICHQDCKRHSEQMGTVLRLISSINTQMFESSIGDFKTLGATAIYEAIQSLASKIDLLRSLTEEVERTGSTVGSHIIKIKVADLLNQLLVRIDPANISAEAQLALRKAFFIEDPRAELTWTRTSLDVKQQLESLEEEIGRATVLLQTFDLVRQVIEHRLNESELIKKRLPDLKSGALDWQNFRTELFQLVLKNNVTDQEKSAGLFYLGEAYRDLRNSDFRPPQVSGDVLLF